LRPGGLEGRRCRHKSETFIEIRRGVGACVASAVAQNSMNLFIIPLASSISWWIVAQAGATGGNLIPPQQMPASEPLRIDLGPSVPLPSLAPQSLTPAGPELTGDWDDPSGSPYAQQTPRTGPELRGSMGPGRPPDAREGFFQKLILHNTWLAPGGGDDLGIYQWEAKSVWALPTPIRQAPLLITPGFSMYFLDGPEVTDLPPRVYDAYLQLRCLWPALSWLTLDASVGVGAYSDFDHWQSEALRIPGYAAGVITFRPELKLILGAAYLDREDISLIPVAGLIWRPSDDWLFELLPPRPRIARRVDWPVLQREGAEKWLYLAGEFGGGSWAITRASGLEDIATYRDFRLMLGIENKVLRALSWRVEGGYVFGRKLSYESQSPGIRPSDTALIRASLYY